MNEAKKHFSKMTLMIFLGVVVSMGIQYLALYIATRVSPDIYTNGNVQMLVSFIPLFIIGYPAMYLLVNTVPKAAPREKHNMTAGQLVLAIIMSISALYVLNITGTVITTVLGKVIGKSIGNVVYQMVDMTSVWIQIPIMVFLAPILEELIFRKLIIDRAIGYGEKTAILLSAVVFALYHGNIGQAIYALGLGAFFAFIYVRTGQIKYSMIMHMVVNFFGSVVAGLVLQLIKYDEFIQISGSGSSEEITRFVMDNMAGFIVYGAYFIAFITVVITGIVLWIVSKKKMFIVKGENDIPKGEMFKTVYLNIGMILFVLFTLVFVLDQIVYLDFLHF